MTPADRLRHAVAVGDFLHARELVPVYTGWVADRLAVLPPNSAEARRLAQESHALFRWMRACVLCARAQCAAQWEQAGRVQGYMTLAPARRTWELRG